MNSDKFIRSIAILAICLALFALIISCEIFGPYDNPQDPKNQNSTSNTSYSVISVAAEGYHTMILKTDGTLWATGNNYYGQLGDGTTVNRYTPVQIMSDVKAVAAGGYHTMILKTDGTLWATGDNYNGQLGDGTTTARSRPVQIM